MLQAALGREVRHFTIAITPSSGPAFANGGPKKIAEIRWLLASRAVTVDLKRSNASIVREFTSHTREANT